MRKLLVVGLLCIVCGVYPDRAEAKKSGRDKRKSTDSKSEVSRPEANYAALKEAMYQLPFGAGVSEIADWAKAKGLSVADSDMDAVEKYKKAILFHMPNITPLSYLGQWDPNSDWPLKQLLELEQRLATLPTLPLSEFNRPELELVWAADVRDCISALKNPCYVQGGNRYPLAPVFQLRRLRRSHIDLYRTIRLDGGLRFVDDRLLRTTAVVHFRKPHSPKDIDPLQKVDVYFVHTKKDEWKSFAAMADLYSTEFDSQRREILAGLNSKYGRGAVLNRIPDDLLNMYHRITGNEVEALLEPEYDAPICLKWKDNVFGLTGRPLEEAGVLRLLYYEVAYAAEVVQTHAEALADFHRQYNQQKGESLKQLKGNF